MARKILEISGTPPTVGGGYCWDRACFVRCDDETLWVCMADSERDTWEWVQLPPIPQPEPAEGPFHA